MGSAHRSSHSSNDMCSYVTPDVLMRGSASRSVQVHDNLRVTGTLSPKPDVYITTGLLFFRFDLPENKTAGDQWVKYTLVVSQYEKKREVRYLCNLCNVRNARKIPCGI